jgi:hypothetical protein
VSATITPVPTDVLTAVRSFLLGVLPANTPVVQGIQNRVAMSQAAGFVLMTPLYQMRLATNVDTYDDTYPSPGASFSAEQDTRIDVQLDFYGPLSGAWAAMVSTLWRDEYGVNALAPNCAPLYIDDARMMPLVDGEMQYEQRWTCTGTLQFNPVTTLPQQFAGAAKATLIDVDMAYPP